MKIYCVTGWKNTGKTGLMERLVRDMAGRRLQVSTIKHAHHDVETDLAGRDSYRHRQAGAREVVLSSPRRWAVMYELRGNPEPALKDLIARLTPVDIVLVEGYKHSSHPKIEVYRGETGCTLLAPGNPRIRAVVSNIPLSRLSMPVLPLGDTTAIADFILHDLGMMT